MKPLVGNVKLNVSPAPSESSNHPSPGVFIFLGENALIGGAGAGPPSPKGLLPDLGIAARAGDGLSRKQSVSGSASLVVFHLQSNGI